MLTRNCELVWMLLSTDVTTSVQDPARSQKLSGGVIKRLIIPQNSGRSLERSTSEPDSISHRLLRMHSIPQEPTATLRNTHTATTGPLAGTQLFPPPLTEQSSDTKRGGNSQQAITMNSGSGSEPSLFDSRTQALIGGAWALLSLQSPWPPIQS